MTSELLKSKKSGREAIVGVYIKGTRRPQNDAGRGVIFRVLGRVVYLA